MYTVSIHGGKMALLKCCASRYFMVSSVLMIASSSSNVQITVSHY